uniref:Zinc knuckle CX2CX4HX4C n=1 Tax=Tanacetum cinerariifolium TaxID=118510 RepID=A0A6L2KTM8_TANCI|nr:zinc knuckle CX2CX4HX4C [Tanacetum cinerariifolium]
MSVTLSKSRVYSNKKNCSHLNTYPFTSSAENLRNSILAILTCVTTDGEALLRGVAERLNILDPVSITDIMVSDVNAHNIQNHDVVAELFGASLKSYTNIDDFTKDIELDMVVSKSTKSTCYAGAAGASAKDQPKVSSNFRPLVVDLLFDGVNISIPRKVVEQVKLHDVPIRVFKEDGISLIATFIGKPVMLDSYTSSMFNDSWGRSSFARCLIEVNSDAKLVDVVTIGIPALTGDGFTKETIRDEYE